MKTFLCNFRNAWLGALTGLCLASLAGTGLLLVHGFIVGRGSGAVEAAIGLVLLGMIIGAVPALTYGATCYALLLHFGHAGYLAAAVAGALPGLFWMAFGNDAMYSVTILFGALTGAMTHFAVKTGMHERAFTRSRSVRE
jgi:hypothetical protein